jgi:energy-coupling factor transport system permease protein
MLTLRFFPLLLQDMEIISEVHRTRGLELDKGTLWTRLKNRMILILPLLSNSLERSIQSSEALEARGFDVNKKRFQYRPLRSNNFHILQIFIALSVTVIIIYFRTLQYGSFIVYPSFSGINISNFDVLILCGWSLFNVLLLGSWKLSGKPQNGGDF